MKFGALLFAFISFAAYGITPEAREFIELLKKLEPVQCEKRQLRRGIALARAEGRGEDSKKLEKRFAELNRQPETARMEKRLAELEKRIVDGKGSVRDPEDLQAISFQQREAFYRCE